MECVGIEEEDEDDEVVVDDDDEHKQLSNVHEDMGTVEQELRVPKETAPPCEPGVDVEQRRNVHPCI